MTENRIGGDSSFEMQAMGGGGHDQGPFSDVCASPPVKGGSPGGFPQAVSNVDLGLGLSNMQHTGDVEVFRRESLDRADSRSVQGSSPQRVDGSVYSTAASLRRLVDQPQGAEALTGGVPLNENEREDPRGLLRTTNEFCNKWRRTIIAGGAFVGMLGLAGLQEYYAYKAKASSDLSGLKKGAVIAAKYCGPVALSLMTVVNAYQDDRSSQEQNNAAPAGPNAA